MGILSATPSSRRGYLSQDELEQFANIAVTDSTEADDQISQAEEIIDGFVGFQEKWFVVTIKGRCSTAGGSTYFYLDSDHLSVYQKNYFIGMEVEILGGTGVGQRRRISESAYASGKITVADAWTTNPDTTSFFKIYQLGKFPRRGDVTYYTDTTPYQYFKQIPEAVKRAVAAQVEYIVAMGSDYFKTDKSLKNSERISSYSYENAKGQSVLNKLIAPKAKMLLKGIRNRTGTFA